MATTKIVSPAEFREARINLLTKEKEASRAYDALIAQRRQLPVVEVTKPYTFSTLDNNNNNNDAKPQQTVTVTLQDLFAGRRQLIIYHFMFSPSAEAGCSSCSLVADSLPPLEHLHSHSTSLVVVSRAPMEKIAAYKKRLGWSFPWVSSYDSDFSFDMHVSMDESRVPIEYNYRDKAELLQTGHDFRTSGEQQGVSVFYRGGYGFGEQGKVYHTYSAYARGVEPLVNTMALLDMTPLGRQDGEIKGEGLGYRRRDEYSEKELQGLH